jgi:uncharacterized protein YlxW (UPF0749 family)
VSATEIVGAALFVSTLVAATLAIGWYRANLERDKKKETERADQLESINTQVATLVAVNDELRLQRTEDRIDFERQLADERRECSTRIAALEGRLEVLTGDFVKDLVHAVAGAMRPSHEEKP